MYKGKYVTELSMEKVCEYYDALRRKLPSTDEEWRDLEILRERLIDFAYKTLSEVQEGEEE